MVTGHGHHTINDFKFAGVHQRMQVAATLAFCLVVVPVALATEMRRLQGRRLIAAANGETPIELVEDALSKLSLAIAQLDRAKLGLIGRREANRECIDELSPVNASIQQVQRVHTESGVHTGSGTVSQRR
jgi:hypothetical protein